MNSSSHRILRRGLGVALAYGGFVLPTAWSQDLPVQTTPGLSNPAQVDLTPPNGMNLADITLPPADSGLPDFNAPVVPDTRPVRATTEGPLHEAFLSPAKDREPVHVAKAPPNPINERPGVEPTDASAVWIPGYWEWDAGKQDFVWATGTYRIPPPGRFWVNGYWKRDDNGWYRVSGFWSDRQTDRIDWRKDGPPTTHPDDEVGSAPGEDYFYIPGHYAPDGTGVVWKKGYWSKTQPDWAWVPAQWVRQPEGWTFQEGYWDRTLEDRGTLFAPALVSAEARDAGATYQPLTQVMPMNYGQIYGALGRPNSNYDGYPGCYFDNSGNYYGYANYGNLGNYYGYLDYPYNSYAGANYIATTYGGSGYGYYPGYYGGSSLGFGNFGGYGGFGGLLGGLFGGYGSSYYGYGLGYYPGYFGGLGFGGLGYGLGGFGYGLGLGGFGYGGYGYGGYGGYGNYGRNWYGHNGNNNHYPYYPGHHRGNGAGNWNGNGGWNGNGRGNGNGSGIGPGQNRNFVSNSFNNAVRNATINTGTVNRSGAGRSSFVNHVGNPANLAHGLRNPGSMAPAASHPYGNPFLGSAGNTQANRGIGRSSNNWSPGFNGVHNAASNHTAARPAFTSNVNSGSNVRANGTMSGPLRGSTNAFQGNSNHLGATPGRIGNPGGNSLSQVGNQSAGFAHSGANLNQYQNLQGAGLNHPQNGGANHLQGAGANHLSNGGLNNFQGAGRPQNLGGMSSPRIGGNAYSAPHLGGGGYSMPHQGNNFAPHAGANYGMGAHPGNLGGFSGGSAHAGGFSGGAAHMGGHPGGFSGGGGATHMGGGGGHAGGGGGHAGGGGGGHR